MRHIRRSRAGSTKYPEMQKLQLLEGVAVQTKSAPYHVKNSHRDGALPQVRQGSGMCKTLFH